MTHTKLRYNGHVYRLARTRDDVSWARVAEITKELHTISIDTNIPSNTKRELARDKVLALLERFKLLGLRAPTL